MKKKLGAALLVVALVLVLSLGLVTAVPVGASPGPGIVGLWHFDGDAIDSSGNGNDGTLKGNATYGTGMFDQALSLDGVGDYVEVGDDSTLDITAGITLEAWIYPDAVDSYRTVVAKRAGNLANYALRLQDGKLVFYYSGLDADGGPDWHLWKTSSAVISTGSWYHVAIAFTFGSDGSITAYVNGAAVSGSWVVRNGTDPATPNSYALTIGMVPPGWQYFKGRIDEVRIWDEALTAAQIADVSPPVVTINAPVDGASYLVGMVPAGAYTVDDENDYAVGESGWFDTAGMHTYTVTATDVLGYVGSASVSYYVLQSYVTGGGIIKDGKKPVVTFSGTVGVLEGVGIVGQFQIADHTVKGAESWHSSNFTSLNFTGDPAESPLASHDTATFRGTFTSNRDNTMELWIKIIDNGEGKKGPGVDEIGFSLDGVSWFTATIDGGNFQVRDIE